MCRVTTRLFLTSDLFNIELYSVILLCQIVRYSPADNHFIDTKCSLLPVQYTRTVVLVFWLFATVLVVGWKPEPVLRCYAMFTANYIRPYEGRYVDVYIVTVVNRQQ